MTTTTSWSLALEREELVRLAGEQALLSKELSQLQALQHRDKQAVLNLHNAIPTGLGRNGTWLADGMALLTRIQETEMSLRDLRARHSELQKMTGL